MTEHDDVNREGSLTPRTGATPTEVVEPTRQYLVSEQQVRGVFLLSIVGMVVVLVGLLLLATSKPQGRFQTLDETEFRNALTVATDQLEGYELMDDGRARIDIDRAMELVAERGVTAPGLVRAGAGAAEGGQAAGGAADAGQAEGGAGAGGDAADGAGAAESDQAEGDQAEAAQEFDGATAYAVCASCHQPGGQGIPGAFPPLAGHAPELYAADPDFPVLVLLYGMMGAIEVEGSTYNGLMPSHVHLGDAELAAILNHVMTAFGNEELLPDDWQPYEAADITEHRDLGLNFDDVHQLRAELDL